MVKIGLIAGFSPSACASESIRIGMLFKANALEIAETPAPGERRITAICDQAIPSRKCAVLKACAM